MKITRRKFFTVLGSVLSLLGLSFLSKRYISKNNKPIIIGESITGIKSLSPKPKVIRVSAADLSNWDFEKLNYFETINQERVNRAMDEAVCLLTEKDRPGDAWKSIMSSYQQGHKIALRTNFNPADKSYEVFFNDIIIAPQIINNVIHSLHTYLNVPFKDIIVYELTRPIPQELIRQYIKYPITFIEKPSASLADRVKNKLRVGPAAPDFDYPIEMRGRITDQQGNLVACYLPKVLTRAQHLINLTVFKYHQFELLSGLLKNHYGTVRFSNLMHYPVLLHDEKVYRCTVDLNRHPLIKNLTRLNIIDSIFGSYDYKPLSTVKKPWKTFGDKGLPNSIFMGSDPVAMESVLYAYLTREREAHGLKTKVPDYLQDAADYSLGVFEYQSDFLFKQIEYIEKTITA